MKMLECDEENPSCVFCSIKLEPGIGRYTTPDGEICIDCYPRRLLQRRPETMEVERAVVSGAL